jgi:small-conductance mechanosensitive channel
MAGLRQFLDDLELPDWADQVILGNSLLAWLIAVGLGLASFFALLFARRLLIGRARALGKRFTGDLVALVVALVEHTSRFVLFVVALGIGSAALTVSPRAASLGRVVFVLACAWQAVLWSHQLVDYGLKVFLRRTQGPNGAEPALLASMGVARFILLALVYATIGLIALQNAGVQVGPLIASLGIGGIAVALAAQNVLGDLFASLSIVLDKPFVVGDFIIVGDQMGTVENIGVKTTRLRALSGEQLVFSNNDLLSSRIRNFKRMQERRIVFAIGVVYQTPEDQLRRIPGMLREAIEKQSLTRFDRAHFKSFGASSLDFEAVYFVKSPEMSVYMDIQQAINLEILQRFTAEGIEFAFPTQTIFLEETEAAAKHARA